MQMRDEWRVELFAERCPGGGAAGDCFARGFGEDMRGCKPVGVGLVVERFVGIDGVGVILPVLAKLGREKGSKEGNTYIHFMAGWERVDSFQVPWWMKVGFVWKDMRDLLARIIADLEKLFVWRER